MFKESNPDQFFLKSQKIYKKKIQEKTGAKNCNKNYKIYLYIIFIFIYNKM